MRPITVGPHDHTQRVNPVALTDGKGGCQTLVGQGRYFIIFKGNVFNDDFDYIGSCYRLFLFDCGRVAAERKERRPSRGLRRSGQPDSVWSAGRGFGSFPGDDLVRNHLHAHVDHAFDFCSATSGAIVRAFGSEAEADEVSARDSGRAVRTADRSAKPSADTEIICWWRAGRPRPAGRARLPSLHRHS